MPHHAVLWGVGYQVLVRRQNQEQRKGLGQSLNWSVHGKGKAGQSKQFRIHWFE